MIGGFVFFSLLQFFWCHALSAIAAKTDQSELMQVFAWIPLLQLAPSLAAGRGSLVGFLIGALALAAGNTALFAVAAVRGDDGFSSLVAVLGVGLSLLICLVYFIRIACKTAIARGLPGWVGVLLFIPLLNFFVYPYIAFHDGWIGPNKIGLAIGFVLMLGAIAPGFELRELLNENGGVTPQRLMAQKNAATADSADANNSNELDVLPSSLFVAVPTAAAVDPTGRQPKAASNSKASIRALYELKNDFEALESIVARENHPSDANRHRALELIASIRSDLSSSRETLDATTFEDLASHLFKIEARIHAAPSSDSDRGGQFAPAALDSPGRSTTPAYDKVSSPPMRPFPVQASENCPAGTAMHTLTEVDQEDEEWCQRAESLGGLRHGWYARYDKEGQPESMGQYQDGLRVGVWTRFHPTGKVRAQAEFLDGLQNGWALTFDEAGQRTHSTRFERGAAVVAD